MYRSDGKVSKDFIYEVYMDTVSDGFQMDVTVDGSTYHLTGDPSTDFYYYDVYTISTDGLIPVTGGEG